MNLAVLYVIILVIKYHQTINQFSWKSWTEVVIGSGNFYSDDLGFLLNICSIFVGILLKVSICFWNWFFKRHSPNSSNALSFEFSSNSCGFLCAIYRVASIFFVEFSKNTYKFFAVVWKFFRRLLNYERLERWFVRLLLLPTQ